MTGALVAEASHASLTLGSFVDDVWMPRARRRLAVKTWERDSIVYEKHIRPLLGERPIATIDVEDLVEWQDGLEEAGVGAYSTGHPRSAVAGLWSGGRSSSSEPASSSSSDPGESARTRPLPRCAMPSWSASWR